MLTGHGVAALGAIGFAVTPQYWWGGALAAIGVAGNHVCDMVDGAHARATGQCRNGGELLDHFFDPLSFSYWMIGLGVAAHRLDLAIVCVLWIYATAVLTGIRAKITGVFTLARIGPTEFKTLLTLLGFSLSIVFAMSPQPPIQTITTWSLWVLAALGVGQLVFNLIGSVGAVNRSGAEPDTSEWVSRKTAESPSK